MHGSNRMLLVLMISLAMSLVQVTSVNVALDSIGESLNSSSSQLQWILAGYTLAIGVVLVPAGRLGDLFGRSKLFLIGLAAFTVSSAVCALATDGVMLNVLRLIQGAAAGVFSPQITSIIQRYYRGQERARAFSLFGVVVSATVAVGPVIAGVLIDMLGPELGWRSTFFLNLPLGIIGVITAWMWLPHAGERSEILHDRERRARTAGAAKRPKVDMDPVGILLLVLGVLGLMLPFMMDAAWRWWLLPAGVVVLFIWVRWEAFYERRGREPMVRLSLFAIRSFSFSTAIMTLQFLGMTSVFVILALFLQNGMGQSATITGAIGFPNALASAITAYYSGRYAMHYGRRLMFAALSSMFVGLSLMILVLNLIPGGLSFWWIALVLVLIGFGQGIMGSAGQTQAMLEVPFKAGGIAGGITQTAQRVATAIGNAVMTGILFTVLTMRTDAGVTTERAWVDAASGAYTAVLVTLLMAIILAGIFVRDWKKNPPVLEA